MVALVENSKIAGMTAKLLNWKIVLIFLHFYASVQTYL